MFFSYTIQKLSDPARAHQLKLEVIAKALRWLEMDMDLDEVSSNVHIPFVTFDY